jgi:hypothetical protein
VVLELAGGVGDDLEQLGDVRQVRLTGVVADVGLADGPGLRDDEPDPAVLPGVEPSTFVIPDVAGRGTDEPEGPEAPTVRAALEATVGEG